jgi:hypothetical protein
MDRAGALPVGIYLHPNSLTVCCVYDMLHNAMCCDGNTGPLIHRDGAARAPRNLFWPVPANHLDLALDTSCQTGLQSPLFRFRRSFIVKNITRLSLTLRGVAPPDCLHKGRPCSPKARSEGKEDFNSAEPYYEQS